MPNQEDYRKYLEQSLKRLEDLTKEQFTRVYSEITSQNTIQDERQKANTKLLETVLEHVKETNGRVRKAEEHITTCPREDVESNTKFINEFKFYKKNFKTVIYTVVVGVVISTIGILKSFGLF